jgi:N-acetylglutamate synthase-like GNAT family acetyltransferase
MIRPATPDDFDVLYEIINDASIAYRGVIPEDRWHEPYMPKEELREQIADGVTFFCYCEEEYIVGVMGIQDKGAVSLIRHAYVRTTLRNKGVGGKLLESFIERSDKPILVGTWKAASWAICFYQKHGFTLVPEEEKNVLLRKYWKVPQRQVETSVVLKQNEEERR